MISDRYIFPPLLFLLIVFCAGCLPVTTRSSTSTPAASNPQAVLAAAEAAYSQGQYRAAADNYKKYLAANPDSPRLETVLASYGLSAERAGLLPEAAGAYERLLSQFPAGEFSAEARPRLAGVYLASGDAARAEALAASFLSAERDSARQSRLRLVLAQSQWTRGSYPEAASNFLTVYRSAADQDKAEAREGALASLTRLDTASLEQIQRQYGQNFPGPEATYILLHQAVSSGDRDQAVAKAEYFDRYFRTHALMPQVTALLAAADSPGSAIEPLAFGADYDPRRAIDASAAQAGVPAGLGALNMIGDVSVAVVLPLSGDNASKYAQEIVSGLRLALASYSAAGSVGLKVLDSRGSPQEAARLVNEAAADPKVMAVVGPFLSRESAQAAQAANRAGLPLIAISQRTDLPQTGPNVFRLFLTPKHQAEAVARYSIRTKGHRDLGILYPDDNYGRPMRTYFENEVRRLGANLVVAESYNPQEVDWNEFVSNLIGSKAARRVSTRYQAETPFTTLYLPDSPGVVSQILAQMAYHDVTKMEYLGSPLWHNQEFLTASSRYVQGSVIPVSLSDLSQRPESRRFIADFQKANGRSPDQFAAYGYDAGLAVIKALGQGGRSKADLRRALNQMGTIPGATGPFSFDSNGEYVVEPTLLTVEGRSFVLLREAEPGAR